MKDGWFYRYRWILFAAIITVFYWLLEASMDSIFFFEGSLWVELFYPSIHEIWMRSIITLIILGFGIYVQYSVNELRESKNKIDNLYSLLLSIRNINQLIVQEPDLEELLQKTADALLETRGYMDITLAILKEDKILPVAHSGDHDRKSWSVDLEEEGGYPDCIKEILESEEEKVIQSTSKFCEECDYCHHKGDHKAVVMPLISEGNAVGAIHTCLEKDREIREEEIELLDEIAGDLAYARERILVEKEKKEAEEQLRKSEERYRELFESVKSAIVVHGPEGDIISANPAAEEAFGLKEEGLKERSLDDWKGVLYKENGREMDIDEFPVSKVYDSKEPVEEHVIGISNEGTDEIGWYIITAVPRFNEKGGIERVIASFKNITERKRAEEESEERHRQLKTLFGNLPGMAYRCLNNKDWTMKFVSEGCEELTGYEPDELIDDKVISYAELILPEDREKVANKVQEAIDKNEPFEVEYRIKDSSGEVKWVWERGKEVDFKSEKEYLEGMITDITEKKEAKKELRESRERLEKVIEEAPFPIMLHAEDGEVIKINEVWTEITGYDQEEIPTISDWTEKAYGEKKEEIKQAIESLHEKEEKTSEGKFEIITKDGEKRVWDFMSTTVGELSDGRSLVLRMAQDITERQKAEERKEFLNTLLRQDLRSKCQTIQGYFQLLEEEADLPERHREYLEKSMKGGREADEILDLAKDLKEIEESKSLTEKDIVKVFEHVLDNISGLAEEKGIKIEENYPEEIGKVEGDYSLKTLFTQLLAVRIQTSECNKIRIEASEREKDLLLKIEDDGKQLPNDIKNLFSGDVYTGETTGAGGVRYYMLREIAEHNDCRIEVKDSEMGGARFDLELKRADQ